MNLAFDIKVLQNKKLAVYGTGNNARDFFDVYGSVLTVTSVIDPTKTGEFFSQKKILSIEEAIETAEVIVVCASINIELIIYDRICSLCREKGIGLYGINGGDLHRFYGIRFHRNLSEEELLRQIGLHDIISFDLFDTLLARRTLYPADVYEIVQSRMADFGIKLDNYYFNRIQTELSLVTTKEFLLDEIYNRLQVIYNLDDETKERIKQAELQVEREISVSRKAMSEIFAYALSKGKRIFILTDMYLPKSFLKELLDRQRVGGYEDILVSGELRMSKCDGMYTYFKETVGSTNILHIGDNDISDGYFARKEGIDVCLVSSARDMLMRSEYKILMNYSGGVYENIAIGMFAARAFGNAIIQTNIKPETMNEYAGLFLAPLVTGFTIWIALEARKKSYEKVLFAARDGFLLLDLYERLRRLYPEYNLPEGVYLYVSRKAVWHVYEKMSEVNEKNNNYIQYLEKLKLKKNGRYAFVDMISQGTTQAALEKMFFEKLEGLYLTQYIGKIGYPNKMCIHSLYKETPITDMDFTTNSNLILETFLTSMEASLREIGENGKLIFRDEYRTNTQLKMIQDVQQTIREYFEIFCKLSGAKFCNKELVRTIWKLRKIADIEIIKKVIKDMKIEDSLNQNMLSFENQL